MTALEFMWACIGIGVAATSISWSIKMVNDVRLAIKSHNKKITGDVIKVSDEPLDPLGKQLDELRHSTFGVPMAVGRRRSNITAQDMLKQKTRKGTEEK